jgi:Protein of unknown function (DUF1329)
MLYKKLILVIIVMALVVGGNAWGKVSKEEAAKLKSNELTPFGAERAGNAEGTIPAWEGGIKEVPKGIGYKGEGFPFQDPYAEDKVLFQINAANISKYENKLTVGVAAFLKKIPGISLNVYQTRRSFAAPEKIYENTYKNATLVEMTKNRLSVIANGGIAGVPFPIPQSAEEIVMNHQLRWRGKGREGRLNQAVVQGNGTTAWGGGWFNETYCWNIDDRKWDDIYYMLMVKYGPKPARRKGEIAVVRDFVSGTRHAWQYLPGQRRVRRAPTIAFDTPSPATSGLNTYDDTFVFNGSLERYDWKIVGKKELYLPYNNYKWVMSEKNVKFTGMMPAVELQRWELHRFWVVEATLKKDARHMYAKRVIYFDEDSWVATASDAYDGKGKIWRFQISFPINAYSLPAVVQGPIAGFDLTRDDYTLAYVPDAGKFPILRPTRKDSFYTPESARREGRR